MTDIQRILDATLFAAIKHRGQRRKGSAKNPYVNHVIDVANRLAAAGADSDTIIAGLLHDTVEDTSTSHDELVARFGERVAGIVAEVTDDKSLEKQVRKQLQVTTAPHKSDAAKRVKIADKTANLSDIVDDPPTGWDVERLRTYVNWSKQVIDGVRGVDPELEANFDVVYEHARVAFIA